ncbi:MAG: VWA domain-containing protein [Pyrinomonadaceae bacterium]
MRKFAALFLLLFLFATFSSSVQAQSRPRRVGQTAGDGRSVPTARPQPDSEANRDGGRAPTLGGAIGTQDKMTARTGDTASPNRSIEVDEDEVVRVNTSLVTIPVSVLDKQGKHVPTLRQREFRIWEDGVEQEIAYFAAVEKPFTVALVLDTSGSTRFRLDEIQDAAIAFVNQLRADDRVLVVSFDDQIRVLSEVTSDRGRLRDAIRRTRPGQGTKLYDAVDFIINQRFNRIDGRKAIVLFTDGVDTTSRRASYQSNARDAEELDALIYPVQYDTYDDSRAGTQTGGVYGGGTRRRPGGIGGILGDILSGGTISIGRGGGGTRGGGSNCTGCTREEYERGNAYLHDLARVTGARLYRADTTRNLANAFALVAEELRRQYSLGYYPKQQGQAGQRRHIKVRALRPDLAVRARDSYIFNPSGANATNTQDNARQPPVLKSPLAQR